MENRKASSTRRAAAVTLALASLLALGACSMALNGSQRSRLSHAFANGRYTTPELGETSIQSARSMQMSLNPLPWKHQSVQTSPFVSW